MANVIKFLYLPTETLKNYYLKPLAHLKQLIKEDNEKRYPGIPVHARVVNTFNGLKNKESKELRRIEKFLNLIGGCKANIIINKGVMMNKGNAKYDFYTGQKTSGGMEFKRSGMQNGISDIVATIRGRSYSIELKRIYKNGRDRQSQAQKDYQEEVEAAGGIYMITHGFEDFHKWFMENIQV